MAPSPRDRDWRMSRSRCACMGWLLCSLIATPVAVANVPAHGTAAPAMPRHIRVVVGAHSPPFLFVDADGKPQGYEADIWRLFQTHTGIQVDLVPMDRNVARQEVPAGDADVVDLIYRTPARDALYDFSAPYASQVIGIYVDRDIRGVHDIASLRGFPVGVERGDSCSEKLASLGHRELREYSAYKALVDDVVSGNLRIFCMDRDAADYYLYRESALARFDMAFVLYTGQPRWAVRKGNARMLEVVEHGMSLITPAERAQLHKRWLEHPFFMTSYLHMAEVASAIIVAIVALMMLWVWMLRRSVVRRTRELAEEKSKLRALFDASPDGMWVKDRNGIYLDCNDRVPGLLRVERRDLVGHTDAELFGIEHAREVRGLEAEVMQLGQQRTYLYTTDGDDGRQRQIEIIKTPLRAHDEPVRGVLSVARDITERVQNEEQLRLWAHTFEHATFGLAIFDARTSTIIAANPVFARERGYAPEELAGKSVDVLYPEDLIEERRSARHEMNRHDHSLMETEQVTRDGRRFPVSLDVSVTHDADGEARYVFVYAQDISERRQAERELRLAAVAFQAQAALLVTDTDQVIQRVNGAFVQLTGYSADEVVGKPLSLLRTRNWDPEFFRRSWQQIQREGLWQGEQWIQGKHGQPKVVRSVVSAVTDATGSVSHYVGSMVDMTSEREAHASVDRMTFFDPLTDLPNRNFLYGRLQQAMDEAGAEASAGALLMLDLDHFKRVNDLRGHAIGDRLLMLVANRLRHLLGEQHVLSRFNGGTFALLTGSRADNEGTQSQQACACAERMRLALHEPFYLGDSSPLTITVSIGWTGLAPGQGSPESVLREAELAMYAAKSAGRDQIRRFQPIMQADLVQHETLVHDLRRAIADQALDLHLQAQVNRRGGIVGAEALLRWTRRNGESVPPDLFIRVAEENGLILPLGEWVLRRACTQLAAWSARAHTRELSLAVNVSARQFAQPEFVEGVREMLAATGAAPVRLKLEITETTILDDLADTAAKLAELRALGIRVSLDDFGTGYSSLAYLARLPLDQLKIDQSFVARLPEDVNDAMVAQSIVGMARGLGLEVIAEGVETDAQWNFLMDQGCDAFQGYLFARPMPCAAFEAMLEDRAVPA